MHVNVVVWIYHPIIANMLQTCINYDRMHAVAAIHAPMIV